MMPKLMVGLVIYFICFATVTFAKLEIHNMINEHGYLNVIVLYTNDTDDTYKAVRIKCTALNSNGKIINFNKRSFYDHEYGPIKPGFSDSLKIPIEVKDKVVDSASCEVYTM
jgi:hypothetical protein